MDFMPANDVHFALSKMRGDTWLCAMIQWRAGLRVSEALALEDSDVDFSAGVLTVRNGKGGKMRTVPLHAHLRSALQATPGSGRYVKSTKYPRTIRRRYQRVGIPKTHILRHSAARHWLNAGVPINQVQLLLGHADMSTTIDYLKLVSPAPGVMEKVP